MSIAKAQARAAAYQDYIDSRAKYLATGHGHEVAPTRKLVFYKKETPPGLVLRDGQSTNYDVAWRASVHFSWFHILNGFDALKTSGRDVLTHPDRLVHGFFPVLTALEQGTVRATRPRFPLTLASGMSVVRTNMPADHLAFVTYALLAVAAWKCGRGHLEQWQHPDAGHHETWLLEAEHCDAMATVFVNCRLPPQDQCTRVLNAAYMLHVRVGHAAAWDVQFAGMQHHWPTVLAYCDALVQMRRQEEEVDADADADADAAIMWTLVPAGSVAMPSVGGTIPLDLWTGFGAMRARLQDFRNDFSWMLVAAYAAFYPKPCCIDTVCSILTGLRGVQDSDEGYGSFMDDCLTRFSHRPASWAEVMIPWRNGAVEDHAVEDHAAEDHAVEDHAAEDHAAAAATVSAASDADADAALGLGMHALESLFQKIVIVGCVGLGPTVVVEDDGPATAARDRVRTKTGRRKADGGGPASASGGHYRGLVFTRPGFAPMHFSSRAKACRDLRRPDLLIQVLDQGLDLHFCDDLRSFCAAAVFMDPSMDDVWELGHCVARDSLFEYLTQDLKDMGLVVDDQCLSVGPGSRWCTKASSALWWWLLDCGVLPEVWRPVVALLIEAAARMPALNPVLLWAVFARAWALQGLRHWSEVDRESPGEEFALPAPVFFRGSKVTTCPVGTTGPWVVVGRRQWVTLPATSMARVIGDVFDLDFVKDAFWMQVLLHDNWDSPVTAAKLRAHVIDGAPLPPQDINMVASLPASILETITTTVDATRYCNSSSVLGTHYFCHLPVLIRTMVERLAEQVSHTAHAS